MEESSRKVQTSASTDSQRVTPQQPTWNTYFSQPGGRGQFARPLLTLELETPYPFAVPCPTETSSVVLGLPGRWVQAKYPGQVSLPDT